MAWEERIWGYTGASGMIQGLAAGYFLWDLVVTSCNLDVFGLGTLAHAIAALFVYSLGFVRILVPRSVCERLTRVPPATLHQLLRLHLYPVGAVYPVPEYPLVLRQAWYDWVSSTAVQRSPPHLYLLFVPPHLRFIPVHPSLPRCLGSSRRQPKFLCRPSTSTYSSLRKRQLHRSGMASTLLFS